MKQSKTCLKCGSKDILSFFEDTGRGGYSNPIPCGLLGLVDPKRYVCCSCGYTEQYVTNQFDIQKLKEHYNK